MKAEQITRLESIEQLNEIPEKSLVPVRLRELDRDLTMLYQSKTGPEKYVFMGFTASKTIVAIEIEQDSIKLNNGTLEFRKPYDQDRVYNQSLTAAIYDHRELYLNDYGVENDSK